MATQILLIEDDVQIRENIEELLMLQGFQVETATNGREGISQAMLKPPDLILCDIMMPEVDGYQVLEVVRNNRSIATVPFIFLTAKSDLADMRRGMDLGADDYLTKPFTLENLLRTIASRLQREALRKADLTTRLEKYRHTLASVTAHEYNTALAGIIGFSSLLIDDFQQFNSEETVSMVTMIKLSGLRLKRSLDNIQLMDVLQQVDPFHIDYNYFSTGCATITAALADTYMLAVEHRQDREIAYQLDVESAPLQISEENLKICLGELLDNAVKFSGSTQTVRLVGKPDGTDYCFTFTNKGQPFKEEYCDQIAPYKQFDRNKYEQQGFGLGLSIVKRILELNHGRLTIESPSEGETTVSMWIPQVVA
ncbi:hybrid sensor histidine kinase/response regulator [Spirosoma sp. KCTC 42546]|uniref:hybrid sensor histidine kinase/response regulator n=1 Tax=Spirosoma sp. KCTC 42546 TaxID=2520506 RepID=UPI00115ACC18|nr:response regulator [Spirosoma sp. KCTC 42546]QDK82755.1 hybrid sensor histidine kinase/response regulator [Spirosoma sp. KCTC 42546]